MQALLRILMDPNILGVSVPDPDPNSWDIHVFGTPGSVIIYMNPDRLRVLPLTSKIMKTFFLHNFDVFSTAISN
jgi:hypothetical protein